MNVVLLVVDSLRACSLGRAAAGGPRTPFLDRLADTSVTFRRAYATECWTLPTHMSMFTGVLPSEHGAHFQRLAYDGAAPTLAELLAGAGHHTEVITRNSLFDGTVPGVTRGFRENRRVLADVGRARGLGVLLALAKPRIRRLIRDSGFFHALQRENRAFIRTLSRMIVPADREALAYAVERMVALQRAGRPYFLFLNLYDVHAPYPPTPTSPLRSFGTLDGIVENLLLPGASMRLGAHAYLREGFRFSPRVHEMLRRRYHDAIELMDAKLAEFHGNARAAGVLDGTMLVVVSDHGEAFGEHGLYFHDASVYQTHLHVPLYVQHSEVAPAIVDDVVSTQDLFTLIRRVAIDDSTAGTLLDPAARVAAAVALSEHFHYPHLRGASPRYRSDQGAAIVGQHKLILRRGRSSYFDLARDPDEQTSEPLGIDAFLERCRAATAEPTAVERAAAHLRRWRDTLNAR